jgi:hypothetical protein
MSMDVLLTGGTVGLVVPVINAAEEWIVARIQSDRMAGDGLAVGLY